MSGSMQGLRQEDGLRTYFGRMPQNGRGKEVQVRESSLQTLVHHVRHSPTGFEWGSAGAGPSDLARSILLDAFGTRECPTRPERCECESDWVEPAYGEFRDLVIANLDKDQDWKLQQGWIIDWVFDFMAAERAVHDATDSLKVDV